MKKENHPDVARLSKFTKPELLELAREARLDVKSSQTKAEIISMLQHNHYAKSTPNVVSEKKSAPASAKPKPPKVETAEALVESSKFDEGANGQAPYPITNNIPETYQRNLLVMLARDPYWSYTYWDLTPEHVESNRHKVGNGDARLILRIYDITGTQFNGLNARRQWDIDINVPCNNWYVHLGTPDCDYLADIGWLGPRGDFVTLARSNAIRTPRDRMSDVVDAEWLTVEENFQKIYRLSGGGTLNRGSGEISELLAKHLRFDVSVSSASLMKRDK